MWMKGLVSLGPASIISTRASGIFRQAGRQHAAGRAAADNHIIIAFRMACPFKPACQLRLSLL